MRDLERSAVASRGLFPTQIPRSEAAFALYQCYIHEFGTTFHAERACHWLRTAADINEDTNSCYLAQAWCWRVHQALDITLDIKLDTLRQWMQISTARGHKKSITESSQISNLLTDSDQRKVWKDSIQTYTNILKTVSGGVGMPHFLPRKMRRQYSLTDLAILDQAILAEYALRGVNTLDNVYVNHRGDGLLHMAASFGNISALKHLVEKYNPDIDIANQVAYETPLLCACRGGHLECALYLLGKGANPQGSQFAEDVPLNWLCAFTEDEIPIIAATLCSAGASLKKHRDHRLPLRSHWADNEYLFVLPMSPLSRAVIMDSLPAVRALLSLGADPLEGLSLRASYCPLLMAALLTLPHVLKVLFGYIDSKNAEVTVLFNEAEMLRIAIDKVATVTDTTSLESRLTRLGLEYRQAMFETLQLLYARYQNVKNWETAGMESLATSESTILARMVALGRVDVVDSLLRLGHSVEGTAHSNPIVEAVKLNHDIIFRLLIGRGAKTSTTVTSIEGSQLSLLQILATRPSQSRPGLFIADYLLNMGVPVDPLPDGTRSAFASAVLRQEFDLADLLVEHGADVEFAYLHPMWGWTTIFGDLMVHLTEKGIDSLKYLLSVEPNKQESVSETTGEESGLTSTISWKSRKRRELPNPIVDKRNGFSILHYAAFFLSIANPSDAQRLVMGEMLNLILSKEVYSKKEAIDMFHPKLGTALWAGSLWGHLEIVSALLERGANPNVYHGDYMPLKLALEGMAKNRPVHAGAQEDRAVLRMRSAAYKRYAMIAELLRKAGGREQPDHLVQQVTI